MAAILDTIVPSRRREKQRLLNLEERLDSRWGDPSITAPNDRGWTTFTFDQEPYDPHMKAFAPLSPVVENLESPGPAAPGYRTDSSETITTVAKDKEAKREQASITVTIPLPWKKSHARSSSGGQELLSAKDSTASPITKSQATSPTNVVYKPAFEDYRKELDRSLGNATLSPPILYKPASDDYKRSLDEMAKMPARSHSPAPYESLSPNRDSRHLSSSSTASHSDKEHTSSDNYDTSSITSSDPTTSDTVASSPSSDFVIPEEVVKSMADVGLSPSPSLPQGIRDRRPLSVGSSPRNTFRESLSSTSSGESAGSGLASPRGLHMATMSSGGGIYSTLAQEYKQIAKTVEEDLVAEHKKKVAAKAAAQQAEMIKQRTTSIERPRTAMADYRRNSSRDRRRDPPTERSTSRHIRTKTDGETQCTRPDPFRAQSVDRYRRYSDNRNAVIPKERPRGVSVERGGRRSASKERYGPQEMVPKAEELWG